jgi:hypothetical protein
VSRKNDLYLAGNDSGGAKKTCRAASCKQFFGVAPQSWLAKCETLVPKKAIVAA